MLSHASRLILFAGVQQQSLTLQFDMSYYLFSGSAELRLHPPEAMKHTAFLHAVSVTVHSSRRNFSCGHGSRPAGEALTSACYERVGVLSGPSRTACAVSLVTVGSVRVKKYSG